MWRDIEQAISAASGETFRVLSERELTGGCINRALCLEGERRSYFLKLNRADRLGMFEAEAAGLTAIAASRSVRAPQAIAWGIDGDRSWLALEFIPLSTPRDASAKLLGERLASMHRCSAQAFSWERDNTIGSTAQLNNWTGDWIEFFGEYRLGFQLELAKRGGMASTVIERGQRLLEQLTFFFGSYQPQPSLLHGDLWGGNWGADATGEPVLFDPAVYFGDREADIAMTELFGGFDECFYRAYEDAWPLDPGYPARRSLYNLYHVLNHFNLFSGAYAHQAGDLIEQLLAQCDR